MDQAKATISPALKEQVKAEQQQVKTVSYLAAGNIAVGFVVISDKIKASSAEAIKKLLKEGLQVFMFRATMQKPQKR